jgi:tetratricopeptide (TPR) repeat protein
MHAEVVVRGMEVRGSARLADGDDVKTGPDGRARIRLDDGTLVVVDAATEFTLHGARITLDRGRLFVQTGAASHTEVAFGAATTTMVSSAAAFERGAAGGSQRVYCAQGELVLGVAGKQQHVASGETATLSGDAVKVAPETAFDDWTGGLAVPWTGGRALASAIPEVWGGTGGDDPGSPLVVRSENVDVEVDGEVAVTHTRTRYFNGSDRDVVADVRMALPPGAIVSRVARADDGPVVDATLAAGARNCNGSPQGRLEWAGSGQLRGTLPAVRAGKSVDLLVDYAEWLPARAGHATYRFPMTNDRSGAASAIGELGVGVRAVGSSAWLSASAGTVVRGPSVELHRSDVRTSGDVVVELAPSTVHAGGARAYVEPAGVGEDPYVLVRTEVPDVPAGGVTLAVVVDTSMSIGGSLLEVERSLVDALLDGLGPRDSIVVLAADQSVRKLGGGKPAPVTPALRAQLRKELAALHAGGASNLGAALEQAADTLDDPGIEHPGDGMVVYLGDGRPTVGEASARELRQRLARRAGGVPRLGAVAVGQGADRWMLADLAAGAGPVYDVVDRPDAARAGAALVADAMEPTLRDVELDLGSTIDRVYPREARAMLAGSTVTVAGRLRGKLPDHIGFRFRRGKSVVVESRPLERVATPRGADVRRLWAQARVEDTVARGDGVELAMTLARETNLLTPWTSWFFGGASCSAPFEERVLGLTPGLDGAFAAQVEPAPPPSSLLLEPPSGPEAEGSLEDAVRAAAYRAIDESLPAMVACRDARAAARPGVGSEVSISLVVGAFGRATSIQVSAVRRSEEDLQLDRCLRAVVGSIPFLAAGVTVTINHQIVMPEQQTSRRTRCSVTSTLPLPVRRGIWRWRQKKGALDYAVAAHTCELPTWGDRRELLRILTSDATPLQAMAIAVRLDRLGETDAAAFVREDVMRRTDLTTLGYDDVRRLLIGEEPKVDRVLDAAYRAARTDEARLEVVRRFLALAPHSPLGRRLLLSLLESMGKRDALLGEIRRIRTDPYADAGLLAQGASTLRRLDLDDEGRRAFGELVERAPRDPWTLGFVGDRLRAEGLYEDALAAYARLERAMPDDAGVVLRLALTHAGAGRLDVATRLLDRVTETGGRGDDGRMGELASIVSASLLARARETSGARAADVDALLVRRLAQTPLPDVEALILVQAPPADRPVRLTVARREKDADGEAADLDAATMGLSAVRIERGGGVSRLRLRRSDAPDAGRPLRATVTALVLGEDRGVARLVTKDVDVPTGGAGVELRWEGGTLR